MDPLNALAPGLDVVKSTWRYARRCIKYVWELECKANFMKDKKRVLVAKEADIKRTLERAAEQGKQPSNEVTVLFEDITKVGKTVDNIASSVERKRRFFLDFWPRLKLARRVIMATQEVDTLLVEISKYASQLVVDRHPTKALELPTPSLVGKSTVEENLEAILNSLRDPTISKIGVYGMGGCGKTTTLKNIINNHLAETNEFGKIIWVTVSGNMILDNVQKGIAQQLNMDLSNYTEEVVRAAKLSERLKQIEKYLIVLDDVWEKIPLDKIGIPHPTTENRCKVLLTTRSVAVCCSMETDKDIKLNLLSEEEAWELFVTKAGDEVLNHEVRYMAEQVARKCAGLPLTIITVGCAMRHVVDVRVWRTTLEYLRSSPTEIQGMEDEVFTLLRFSYSRLKNITVRKCFLYAALFPEDHYIIKNCLISYWIGGNLIKEKSDLEKETDEGHSILKELLDACLVEEILHEKCTCIVMHDILRVLAINIMREKGVIKAGMGLHESPGKNEWENASEISLVQNEIELLPEQLNCPNLSILLLWGNPLQAIPNSFFGQMPCLKVLDLSSTNVVELPTSLSYLINLHTLSFERCLHLEKLPSLAKLEKLRVLNLSCTLITELPDGVDKLIRLRSLDLSFTYHIKNWCTISKLTCLEELRLAGSLIFQKMESTTVANCVEEICSLNSLRKLTVHFMAFDDYINACRWLRWKKLKDFHIGLVGKEPTPLFLMESLYGRVYTEKSVQIVNQPDIFNKKLTLHLLPHTEELQILHSGIPRLSDVLCLRNLRSLKKCKVVGCTMMSGDCLISGEEMDQYTFTNLVALHLRSIEGITVLWKGVVPYFSCLGSLKLLNVVNCKGLKNLFCANFLQHLKNIEEIAIIGCEEMVEVVSSNEEEDHEFGNFCSKTTIFLPRLRELFLWNLSEIRIMSREMWVCVSLHSLMVIDCPKLKHLSFQIDSLSRLQKIYGKVEWWDALEWDDDNHKSLLNPCFEETPSHLNRENLEKAFAFEYDIS